MLDTKRKFIVHAIVEDPRGFQVQFQELQDHNGVPVYIILAYSLTGGLIGDIAMALNLVRDRGIVPELIDESHGTCSIGFSEIENKWYGWSHRAIAGFNVGYIVNENSLVNRSQSFPVGFEAKNLEDCRRLAIAFAEAVR